MNIFTSSVVKGSPEWKKGTHLIQRSAFHNLIFKYALSPYRVEHHGFLLNVINNRVVLKGNSQKWLTYNDDDKPLEILTREKQALGEGNTVGLSIEELKSRVDRDDTNIIVKLFGNSGELDDDDANAQDKDNTRMNEEGKRLSLGEMEENERNWIEARILEEKTQMKPSSRIERTPSQLRVRTDSNASITSWFKYTNEVRVISQEAHSKTDVDKMDGSMVVETMEELINILSQDFDDEATQTELAYLETISEILKEFKLNPGISKSWDPLTGTCSYSKISEATERVMAKWLGPIELEQVQMQYADLLNLSSRQKLVGPMVYAIQKWCNLMEKASRKKTRN